MKMLKSLLNKMWNSEAIVAKRYLVSERMMEAAIENKDEEKMIEYCKAMVRIGREAWLNDEEKEAWAKKWQAILEKELNIKSADCLFA